MVITKVDVTRKVEVIPLSKNAFGIQYNFQYIDVWNKKWKNARAYVLAKKRQNKWVQRNVCFQDHAKTSEKKKRDGYIGRK